GARSTPASAGAASNFESAWVAATDAVAASIKPATMGTICRIGFFIGCPRWFADPRSALFFGDPCDRVEQRLRIDRHVKKEMRSEGSRFASRAFVNARAQDDHRPVDAAASHRRLELLVDMKQRRIE